MYDEYYDYFFGSILVDLWVRQTMNALHMRMDLMTQSTPTPVVWCLSRLSLFSRGQEQAQPPLSP